MATLSASLGLSLLLQGLRTGCPRGPVPSSCRHLQDSGLPLLRPQLKHHLAGEVFADHPSLEQPPTAAFPASFPLWQSLVAQMVVSASLRSGRPHPRHQPLASRTFITFPATFPVAGTAWGLSWWLTRVC